MKRRFGGHCNIVGSMLSRLHIPRGLEHAGGCGRGVKRWIPVRHGWRQASKHYCSLSEVMRFISADKDVPITSLPRHCSSSRDEDPAGQGGKLWALGREQFIEVILSWFCILNKATQLCGYEPKRGMERGELDPLAFRYFDWSSVHRRLPASLA